jgi:CRP/FNR family transcriptional regulator, anaerobic regulatory protein
MLCVTCPNRDFGFCGALFNDSCEDPNSLRRSHRFRIAQAGERLARRREASEEVLVLCRGWAFQYIEVGDQRRQILSFLLPGDLFSAVNIFERQFQSSAMALTDVQISCFDRSAVRAKSSTNALQTAVENAFRQQSLTSNELLAVLGQHSAERRIAYLLQHLTDRLKARNVIREDRYAFPLQQRHIADAVGLTNVHVNRVLRLFRNRGLCSLADGVLTVLNPSELERLGSLN